MAGRRSASLASPEELTLFTESCCGECGFVHFILTPLYNLCSE